MQLSPFTVLTAFACGRLFSIQMYVKVTIVHNLGLQRTLVNCHLLEDLIVM